jgi:hypothetical protein
LFAAQTPRKTYHARKQGFFSVYKAIGGKAQDAPQDRPGTTRYAVFAIGAFLHHPTAHVKACGAS